MTFYLCYIAAFCLIGFQVGAAPLNDEFERSFNKVFGSGATKLSVDETLEELQHMHHAESDPDSEWDPIGDLISASDFDATDCTWEVFNSINTLMKFQSIFGVNILPYLANHRQKRFALCAGKFSDQLESELESLFDGYVEDMKLLGDQISVITGAPGLDIAQSSYAAGIVKYLRRKLGSEFDKTMDRDHFGFLVIKEVGRICGVVMLEIEPLVKNYEQLLGDEQIEAEMSQFEFEWIRNVRICRNIMDNLSPIVAEGHSLIGVPN